MGDIGFGVEDIGQVGGKDLVSGSELYFVFK